jgi:DNA invertase Pin-like site-specific DNA recombinase
MIGSKVCASHLQRCACVYVRQSTAMQVLNNTESTKRQYALKQRAVALGWSESAVEVIDEDLGRSGASSAGRSGFARLAHAVAHGKAGAIFATEVSRLSRSSPDWQRLLSLCAVADVVVVDEQSIYDPKNKDDKLLLDLKGTMSEAELSWLGLRLHGARQSKARRGALRLTPPVGYIWRDGQYAFDPDEAIVGAVRTVFQRFAIESSGLAVARWARRAGFMFPKRAVQGEQTSKVQWKPLTASRVHALLCNPVYAGAYVFGRQPTKQVLIDGEIRSQIERDLPPDQWQVRLVDAHPGYIDWETYVSNRQRLRDNNLRKDRSRAASRGGKALCSGLLLCGRCGQSMRPMYPDSEGYSYVCKGEHGEGGRSCWSVPGCGIDAAVEDLFLSTMVPDQLELCLAVEREVEQQSQGLAQQWQRRIEQASYAARLAQRRYNAVDPDNRTVARTLERNWEEALTALAAAKQAYQQAQREQGLELSEADRARIRALARDLPAVWHAPTTRADERQAMLRMAIEAITLSPIDVPTRSTEIKLQWQSGQVSVLRVPRPQRYEALRTPPELVARIGQLAGNGLRDDEIARQLDAEQLPCTRGPTWTKPAVQWIRRRYQIQRMAPDAPRARPVPATDAQGRHSINGIVERFGVSHAVVRGWITNKQVRAHKQAWLGDRHAWWIDATDEQIAALLTQDPRHVPPKPKLPDRDAQGRYSTTGAAKRFGVTHQRVRSWIRQGLVRATTAGHGPYPSVWWLEIDDATAEHLQRAAKRRRGRNASKNDT